ncbi:RNA polymerase sigma factor [Sinosporangium siamense]|nr:sigma factor [Sinosporangium siamense]
MTRALPAQAGAVVITEQSWQELERFSAIFDRYTEIHGYATRRLGTGLADDVATETFLIVFDKRTRYDISCDDARPWLYGIASNVIARHHRAEAHQYRAPVKAGTEDPAENHADRVTGKVDAGARKPRLARAIAKIADGDRDSNRRPGSGPAPTDSAPPHLHDYRGAVMSMIGSLSTSTKAPRSLGATAPFRIDLAARRRSPPRFDRERLLEPCGHP